MFIKNMLKNIIRTLVYYLPLKLENTIILESNPDMEDSAYTFFQTLLKYNVNEHYQIYWFVKNKEKFKDVHIHHVYFEDFFGTPCAKDKKRQYHTLMKAKYIFDCNKTIKKKNRKQIRVHLTHGMPIKYVPSYFETVGKFDYITATSMMFGNILTELTKNDKQTILPIGLPRNDDLFHSDKQIQEVFPDKKFEQMILWLPTYRQRENHELSLSQTTPLGIPVLEKVEDLKAVNQRLQEQQVLLILKPHPVQDMSLLKAETLSNFLILDNQEMDEKNVKLYELLSMSDALITDYSSVYIDYLLLNRPIAITTDDIETYQKEIGFVVEDVYEILKGEYIQTPPDMIDFIDHVGNHMDVKKEERQEIMKKAFQYTDGNASKRLLDLLKLI